MCYVAVGAMIHTWHTLNIKNFDLGHLKENPTQLRQNMMQIVDHLGQIISFDTNNEMAKNPHFCIALDISKSFATSIEIECGEDEPPCWILMDYDHFHVRCCFAFL